MSQASPNKTVEIGVATIEFALSECIRLHELTKDKKPNEWLKDISAADLTSELPLSSGRKIMCGREAVRRLYNLATLALKDSDAAGTIEPEGVYLALKRLVALRFIEEQRPQDEEQAQLVLSGALEEAKQTRSDRMHFVPCRLMFAKKPITFQIGPVKFQTIASFHESMEPHYAAYAASKDAPEKREICELLLSDARHYYDGFGWVGEVRILNCDPATSKKRALLAVTAALDIIHLLFGAYHTNRMTVAGPRMPHDRRAHLHLDDNGSFDVSCSSNSTSAVGFRDGWEKFLERPDFSALLQIANKILEPLVDPSIRRPLAIRLADAAAWFGDAVREESHAARVVKASNALEHILTTGKGVPITKSITRRAAAVCFAVSGESSFAELVKEFRDFYRLRSDLVHGWLSPFDPEVEERCALSLQLAGNALSAAFLFFESQRLLDRAVTNEQLADGFEKIIRWAEDVDASRHPER
jgi:hypothetical protein